jgi:hypothetical protein
MASVSPVTDPKILAQLNASGPQPVTDPTILAQLNGDQPSTLDKWVASPIGRFARDVIAQPLEGADRLLSGGFSPVANALDSAYANSLARNRNTPGYAAARAQADKATAGNGGFKDQLFGPLLPTIAGTVGLFGGLDSSNAMADSQTAAQDAYSKAHPILSTAAGLAGGLLMGGPEGPAARIPTYATDSPLLTRLGQGKISGPFPMPRPTVPAAADLKAAAKANYKSIDNAGIRVSNDALNRLGDSVQDTFGQRLDPTLHPDATAAYNRVTQYATDGSKGDTTASFTDLDNLRRVVADSTSAIKPADKAMARMILDHVDNFVDGLKATDLDTSLQDQLRADLVQATGAKGQIAKQIKSIEVNKPGALAARGAAGAGTRQTYMDLVGQLPQAEQARQAAQGAFNSETDLLNAGPQATIDALNQARNYWARASQAEFIQKQIDKAQIQAGANYTQSGFENALRQRFKAIALNDRAMARLTPEVQQAVKDVAAGTRGSNFLRSLGKYAPHGPVATAAGSLIGGGAGAMAGGLMGMGEGAGLGALALPAIGEIARTAATARTLAAANRTRDIAALGGVPNIPRQIPIQLPRLTASAVPYGLPLPLLQQQSVSGR